MISTAYGMTTVEPDLVVIFDPAANVDPDILAVAFASGLRRGEEYVVAEMFSGSSFTRYRIKNNGDQWWNGILFRDRDVDPEPDVIVKMEE